MKFRCFFNRFHPRVEPISAWKFVYRWIECKFKKRSHFDDEQYCVFLFFFFVNSLPLWNHTGYHKSTNYRWGKISMLFHVQFCRSYYVRKMRIYLAIDDTRRILNLSLIFLVANVFSNNFQDASRAFLCVYIYENFQIKCEDLKTRTWIKIFYFFLFLHMEQPFVDI